MLVIAEDVGGWIRVGKNIRIRVLSARGRRVRLGFEAPPDVEIVREVVENYRQAGKPVPPEDDTSGR